MGESLRDADLEQAGGCCAELLGQRGHGAREAVPVWGGRVDREAWGLSLSCGGETVGGVRGWGTQGP